jgi:hypothetical protein
VCDTVRARSLGEGPHSRRIRGTSEDQGGHSLGVVREVDLGAGSGLPPRAVGRYGEGGLRGLRGGIGGDLSTSRGTLSAAGAWIELDDRIGKSVVVSFGRHDTRARPEEPGPGQDRDDPRHRAEHTGDEDRGVSDDRASRRRRPRLRSIGTGHQLAPFHSFVPLGRAPKRGATPALLTARVGVEQQRILADPTDDPRANAAFGAVVRITGAERNRPPGGVGSVHPGPSGRLRARTPKRIRAMCARPRASSYGRGLLHGKCRCSFGGSFAPGSLGLVRAGGASVQRSNRRGGCTRVSICPLPALPMPGRRGGMTPEAIRESLESSPRGVDSPVPPRVLPGGRRSSWRSPIGPARGWTDGFARITGCNGSSVRWSC